ncbi:unnamed protein product [Peniophora sp. CBMAI 1063]|nr:unnamed protein product [Peniophora sp. CBMAI 1063]
MPSLQKLTPSVYFFRPADDALTHPTDSPSLIMMFSWMDAQLRHEQKFVDALHQLYPTATIVLIKSALSTAFATQANLEHVLEPVVEILLSRHWDGILMHMFSNGGGFMFMALHKALAKRHKPDSETAHRGPRVVCVLDSLPGDHGLDSLLLVAGPKNPLLYALSVPIFAAACGALALGDTLRGNGPMFTEFRRILLTSDPLPTITETSRTQPPRLYIYSIKDRTIRSQNIERHIEEAKRLGIVVDVERYEDSPHVGHMRCDEKRYWNAVKGAWARAKL